MEVKDIPIQTLMVGDWAYIKEDPMKYELKQVKPEHFVRSLCWFNPVPITDDILEKNGFVYTRQKRWMSEAEEKVWKIENNYKQYTVELENTETDSGRPFYILKAASGVQYVELYIWYVHELQQVMRLLSIDKSITL